MAGNEYPSQANTTGQPRSRQRTHKPAPALEVPDIEENAPERKRILNVLAQRRYREKKRLRRQGDRNKEDTQQCEGSNTTRCGSHGNTDNEVEAGIVSTSVQSLATSGLDEVEFSLSGWTAATLNNNDLGNTSIQALPGLGTIPYLSAPLTNEASGSDGFVIRSSENLDGNATDILPPSWDSTSTSSSDGSFSDSYLLPVYELTLLRAVTRIAERIGGSRQIWNLEAVSPFIEGTATPAEQLPVPWKPTTSQLLVPHHPLLDFLPWPGVRDRVISIFSLPDEMRPPHATGPLALVNFAYDFEDNSEGARIYGSDPYDPNSWEVGQLLFERWWFIFDREVIENSNRWRQLRGAPPLALRGTPT